jgi:hypothetical protein
VYGLAEAIDDADHERIEQLFGDATFRLGDGEPRVGGAALREVIETSMTHHEGGPRTLHVVTNLQIEVSDPLGDASARSYVTVMQGLADFPLQAVLTGRYRDRFRLGDDGWRWTERHMTIVHVGDTSRHTRRAL